MEENLIDEKAAEYVEAVKKTTKEPTWGIVRTAYMAGEMTGSGQELEYGDWQTRLKAEQVCLKERLSKLVDFINSEKFYELSPNNKQLLRNQKVAMELYLSVLNMRVFEDVDGIVVPDLNMLQMMGNVFGGSMFGSGLHLPTIPKEGQALGE